MPTPSGHTAAIRASDVIGTPVRSTTGETIGKVEDIVLDKLTNAIMFAVVSFGGFLGLGEKYHAIPWMSLDFDPEADGYVIGFTREQLEQAPSNTINELTKNDGIAFRDAAYEYYDVRPYW